MILLSDQQLNILKGFLILCICHSMQWIFKEHTSASPRNRSSISSAVSIQFNWSRNSIVNKSSLSHSRNLWLAYFRENMSNSLQIELKLELNLLDHICTAFSWMINTSLSAAFRIDCKWKKGKQAFQWMYL